MSNSLFQLTAGICCGLVSAIWIHQISQGFPDPVLPTLLPAETVKMPVQTNENEGAVTTAAATLPPKTVKAKAAVVETIRTGDPRRGNAPPDVSGSLPANLRFRWRDDPRNGLAPAFLWKVNGRIILGDRQVAPQDGDILGAYALNASTVIPEQHGGRLFFHRTLLARLLEWCAANPELAATGDPTVEVLKVGENAVKLILPAVGNGWETQILVKL